MKSGNLNFLEPSGPLQACNGIALPLPYYRKCTQVFMRSTRYFWSHCVETLSLSTDFRKILKYQISLKSVQYEPSCSMSTDRRADGQKDGETIRKTDVTKLIVACRNFAPMPYNNNNNNNNNNSQGTNPR